jgi:hypothetical protein
MNKSVFLVPIVLALLTGAAWGATKLTVGLTTVHALCGGKEECSGVTCGKTKCDASCGIHPRPNSGCTLTIKRTKPKRPPGGPIR